VEVTLIGKQKRLVIYEGDNHEDIVRKFASNNKLSKRKEAKLIQIVQEQLSLIQMPTVDEESGTQD
jgi:hypothetical protein